VQVRLLSVYGFYSFYNVLLIDLAYIVPDYRVAQKSKPLPNDQKSY